MTLLAFFRRVERALGRPGIVYFGHRKQFWAIGTTVGRVWTNDQPTRAQKAS